MTASINQSSRQVNESHMAKIPVFTKKLCIAYTVSCSNESNSSDQQKCVQ